MKRRSALHWSIGIEFLGSVLALDVSIALGTASVRDNGRHGEGNEDESDLSMVMSKQARRSQVSREGRTDRNFQCDHRRCLIVIDFRIDV